MKRYYNSSESVRQLMENYRGGLPYGLLVKKKKDSVRQQLLFKIDLPGTDISAILSRASQTGVAVPTSQNAS